MDDEDTLFDVGALVCIVQNSKWRQENVYCQYMNLYEVQKCTNEHVWVDDTKYGIRNVIYEHDSVVKTRCENMETEEEVLIATFNTIPGENPHQFSIGSQVCVTYDKEYAGFYPDNPNVFIGMITTMVTDDKGGKVFSVQFDDGTEFTYTNECLVSSLECNVYVEDDNWVVHIVPIQYNSFNNIFHFSEKPFTLDYLEYYQFLLLPLSVLFVTVVLPHLCQ